MRRQEITVDAALADRSAPHQLREPVLEQISSFIGFFIYLLILKTYFIPLFQIPTGSMAEGLFGAHVTHTCPNCGWEYSVGTMREVDELTGAERQRPPFGLQCPNCHWRQVFHPAIGLEDATADQREGTPLRVSAGDRIVVHGWPWELGGSFGPRQWDVVVFKVPTNGEENYIKRLIGLPGHTIEIVDGDIFVDEHISRKPAYAQSSLWFPVYHNDFRPAAASQRGAYLPRWEAVLNGAAWSGLKDRVIRFDDRGQTRGEIQFVTKASSNEPGEIRDMYGYNEYIGGLRQSNENGRMVLRPIVLPRNPVTDVRLAANVTFEEKRGYVELILTKHEDRFFARLTADGKLTLERAPLDGGDRLEWDSKNVAVTLNRPMRLTFSNADYLLRVELDGREILRSDRGSDHYTIDIAEARKLYTLREQWPAQARIAAEGTRLHVAHIDLDRDVYYTVEDFGARRAGKATIGHPLKLGPDQYFVLGDNSPQSLDARWGFDQSGFPVGKHLEAAEKAGRYQPGTVPGDQLIGKAFLVYWPGFLPLAPEINPDQTFDLVPDLGRVRWIH